MKLHLQVCNYNITLVLSNTISLDVCRNLEHCFIGIWCYCVHECILGLGVGIGC